MAVTYKNPSLAFYVEDTTYGEAPTLSTSAGGKKLKFMRLVNEDLNATFSREESNEIRGDAQTSGSVITGASGSGNISIQYSLETYDQLLPGLLFAESTDGAWEDNDYGWTENAADPSISLSGGATFAANTLTLTGVASAPVASGDWIYLADTGVQNLDGAWKVKTATSDTNSTLELYNDTGNATDIAGYAGITGTLALPTGASLSKVRDVCRNGTNEVTYGFVRSYSDTSLAGSSTSSTTGLTGVEWSIFRGAYVTSMQLSVAPGQAGWTGSFTTLFKGETSVQDILTSPATGSKLQVTDWQMTEAPNSKSLPDAINGVGQITIKPYSGGAEKQEVSGSGHEPRRYDALSLNMNISNNSEEVSALRNQGALCVNQGTTSATIDVELIYDEDGRRIHDEMAADGSFCVEVCIKDADGFAQLWRFPKCKLTSERPNAGKNQPIVQSVQFTVEAGGTPLTGTDAAKMIEVARFYRPSQSA